MEQRRVAEAFSGHRFAETYDAMSPDVRWVVPGQDSIDGKDAVVAACEAAAGEMAQLASTTFTRFVSGAGDGVAVVDAVGRYLDRDGATSVVSSADVYEFDGAGLLVRITSYAVDLDDAAPPVPGGGVSPPSGGRTT